MVESNKRQKTKMIIENAMVELLEHESFDQISTVKLTKTAGISRSSFYTHYKDKYDMIEHYQQKLFHKLEYIFDKYAQDKRSAIIEVFDFLDGANYKETKSSEELEDFSKAMLEQGYIEIETLEGIMKASFGDYIIKGIKGEFYPCKSDIFQATYEEVR